MGSYGADCEQKWICEFCTYSNFPSSIKCTMCRSDKPSINQDIYGLSDRVNATPVSNFSAIDATWICESCNYRNQENDFFCFQCNTPISLKKDDETAITLQELMKPLHISPSKCEIKELNSPTQNTSPTTKENKWCCTDCTYENWPRTQKCAMCGTKKNIRDHQQQLICRNITATPEINDIEMATNHKTFSRQNQNDLEQKIRLQRRKADSKWLNACIGVLNEDQTLVDIYLASGGDVTRKLSASDVSILNNPSVFEVGQTLVHLAIRYHREDILSRLLAEIKGSGSGLKRVPSYVAPDQASDIRRYVSSRILNRSGDFPCFFLSEITTFALPEEIEAFPIAIQEQLYAEILDQDAQDQLEAESPVINWSTEVTDRLGSRLNVLWNRSAGDCLLDSAMQATFGVSDRDNTLRRALADSLIQAGHQFYPRWKEYEATQAMLREFSLDETQFEQDWLNLLSTASQPGSSLEQLHIFALSHILRRPIVVYGVKYFKSFRGETLDYARFQGVYLPLLWEPSFCSQSPIALGYTRGHFSALVPFQPFSSRLDNSQGQKCDDDDDDSYQVAFLPLMDHKRKLLPVHFLIHNEVGKEELILHEWLDVCETQTGILVAQQKIYNQPLLVAQIIEEWLNYYRNLVHMTSAPFVRPSVQKMFN